MLSRIKKRHIALICLLAALATLSIIYLQSDQENGSVVVRSYDQDKDYQPVVRMIKENMFWMSESPDFSPEEALTLKAPAGDPSRKGLANFLVVEAEGATAAFISFYKKSPEKGYIWQLVVDKPFRGRHFSEKLIKASLDRLKQQGAKYVTLATRLINKRALSLYKKFGFVEEKRDESRGIIFLIKRNL